MSEIFKNDIETIVAQDLNWTDLDGKSVLITGASGMVGAYVTCSLLEAQDRGRIKNLNLTALVRDKGRATKAFGDYAEYNQLKIIEQDVAEPISDIEADYIVHAASPASPDRFKKDPVGVIRANILGSFAMLELARKQDANFCLISTMEVYGQLALDGEEDEISVNEEQFGALNSLDLRSAYPESKRAAENLVVAYNEQYGVDYRIARMTHTYGPKMDINDTRVQMEFIRKVISGEDIVLKSDGSLKRTYTYITDAISGLFHIILNNEENKVFNIANEEAKLTIKDLAETAIKAGDSKSRLLFDVGDSQNLVWSKTKNTYADSSRLRSIGWKPQVLPLEGLRRSIDYYKEAN